MRCDAAVFERSRGKERRITERKKKCIQVDKRDGTCLIPFYRLSFVVLGILRVRKSRKITLSFSYMVLTEACSLRYLICTYIFICVFLCPVQVQTRKVLSQGGSKCNFLPCSNGILGLFKGKGMDKFFHFMDQC